MTDRLILGPPKSGEAYLSGDAHPSVVRASVRQLLERPGRLAVATWSPRVVDEILKALAERDVDREMRVFLRGPRRDVAVGPVFGKGKGKGRRWAGDVSLGTMLQRGDFDDRILDRILPGPPPRRPSDAGKARFEDGIELTCCGRPARLVGNLSLRGAAGARDTRLGYECVQCFRRIQVVDQWNPPSAAQLAIYDETP